ncbi:hypothetical protein FRC10_003042 [Ceratobasidium sp. 414]|nr:hypothetical protein FRC10_003042 [Ceratobasidium sp. 414]
MQLVAEQSDCRFKLSNLVSSNLGDFSQSDSLAALLHTLKDHVENTVKGGTVEGDTPERDIVIGKNSQPLLLEITGMDLPRLRQLAWSWLKYKYAEAGGVGKVPFEEIGRSLHEWFDPKRLPPDFIWMDPSSMTLANVLVLFDWILQVQSGELGLKCMPQYLKVNASSNPIDASASQETSHERIQHKGQDTYFLRFDETVTKCHAVSGVKGMKYSKSSIAYTLWRQTGNLNAANTASSIMSLVSGVHGLTPNFFLWLGLLATGFRPHVPSRTSDSVYAPASAAQLDSGLHSGSSPLSQPRLSYTPLFVRDPREPLTLLVPSIHRSTHHFPLAKSSHLVAIPPLEDCEHIHVHLAEWMDLPFGAEIPRTAIFGAEKETLMTLAPMLPQEQRERLENIVCLVNEHQRHLPASNERGPWAAPANPPDIIPPHPCRSPPNPLFAPIWAECYFKIPSSMEATIFHIEVWLESVLKSGVLIHELSGTLLGGDTGVV